MRIILLWMLSRSDMIYWYKVNLTGCRIMFNSTKCRNLQRLRDFKWSESLLLASLPHRYTWSRWVGRLVISFLSFTFDTRTYAAMETLTEPHTLTATLSCMIGMARSLISPNNLYPEGCTHVLPLLMGSLPGVDPNDFSKCMVSNECVDY